MAAPRTSRACTATGAGADTVNINADPSGITGTLAGTSVTYLFDSGVQAVHVRTGEGNDLVAAALDLPGGTIASRISRCLGRLRTELGR